MSARKMQSAGINATAARLERQNGPWHGMFGTPGTTDAPDRVPSSRTGLISKAPRTPGCFPQPATVGQVEIQGRERDIPLGKPFDVGSWFQTMLLVGDRH